jgi:hypothetical protein
MMCNATKLIAEWQRFISKFDLCKFSYGYSRVENGPKVRRHERWMPVSLNLFQKVQVGHESRHPVYVLEQSSEAFYFKLDEQLVRSWLRHMMRSQTLPTYMGSRVA